MRIKMPSFHAKNDYELFIQAMKGYEIIGPMRAQGDTYTK
jgi:hypothetical protein